MENYPDVNTFNKIWEKARLWLTEDEFVNWLCFCYGAMSATAVDRKVLADSINGEIYHKIALRGMKKKY